jgi:MFS family permease
VKLPNLPLQFKFLILFRFITTVGMQMKMTILGYFLFKITKEPLTLGYLGLYEAIPRILMSLPAGYIVERMEKRKALMIVVFTYFLSTLGIALSMYFLQNTSYLIPLIFVIILIMGLVGSLGPSASVSIFSHIISKEDTPRFAAINSNVWQIGAIVGPIIGGYLIHVFGETIAMFSVAAILSISILSVLFIEKIPSLNTLPFNFNNSITQIREGLDFVFNNKILLWAISLDLFAVLFGGAVALLPVFAEEILHVGSQGYGWLKAAMPIGSAISMILLAARPLQKNTGKWLLFSIAMFGIFTLVFAVSKNIYLSLAMLFLMGAFDAVSVIIRSTLLILETPVEMKARVASVNQMFISSSNEIGAFESGFAAQYMGTVRSVIFGGSMTLFFVILAFKKAKALVNFEFINYKNDDK